MAKLWEADPAAGLKRRLGRHPAELGETNWGDSCPDIWELDNGDVAVIGRDLTDNYATCLPPDVILRQDERLVVVPRSLIVAAKPDIPNA